MPLSARLTLSPLIYNDTIQQFKLGEKKKQVRCNVSQQGFEYVSNNLSSPWIYPKPRLLGGFLSPLLTGGLPDSGIEFPLTTADAVSQGWAFDSTTCKWSNSALYSKFKLSYMDNSILSVEIEMDPALFVDSSKYGINTVSGKSYYEVFFNDGENNFGLSDQNGLVYPLSVTDAVSKQYGYHEGSCVHAMGGYHYYNLPWSDLNAVTPIYDTLGTSQLSSMLIAARSIMSPFTTNGFDNDGFIASGQFACDFNNCNKDGCLEFMKEITSASVALEDQATSFHLMWDVDPSNPTTWKSCGNSCPAGTCSCCDGLSRTDCAEPYPPVYP